MVLVALDVGKHYAPLHSRSTFYYLFLSWWLNSDLLSHLRQRLTLKGCRGSVLQAAAPLHKVTFYETGNWSTMSTTSSLSDYQPVFYCREPRLERSNWLRPARRGSLCDHGTVYCRQDSVVLKSELIPSRGGVGTREIYWFSEYHTGDYHLSLCIHDYLPLIMNSVLIGSRSLPSFVVLEIGHRRDALYWLLL